MNVESGPGGHLLVVNNLADVLNAVQALKNLGGLASANNLSDVASASTALSNLGGMPFGDSGWTNVSVFTNSWASHGAGVTPRFMLIGRTVYMQGQIQSGTIGSAAFTLPSGYRPSQTCTFTVNSGSALGLMSISTAGVVTPATGTNLFFEITCTFPVV